MRTCQDEVYVVTRVERDKLANEVYGRIWGVFEDLESAKYFVEGKIDEGISLLTRGGTDDTWDYELEEHEPRHERVYHDWKYETHWFIDKVNFTEEVWNGGTKKKKSGSPTEEGFGEGQTSGAAGTTEE